MLSLKAESWTWYAITLCLVCVRLTSRRLLLGSWRKLQADDALMVIAMAADTVIMVGMNIISNTSSNLIDPDDTAPLDADNIKERIFGSKMVLVVEQMQCITVWLVKACLLIMYHRLTMSLRQNLAVKILAGYVAVTFVVMEILYLGVWCRPFNQYWAVPPDNTQCNTASNHLITNMVFNISSDIAIILIPMPVFLSTTLSARRKAILCAVFAVGVFTIISAVLNKYYSFTQPFGLDWTFWYIRESSTALIVANLPLTWTFLQRVFNLKAFREKYYSNQRSHTGDPSSRFRSTNYGGAHSSRGRNPRSTLRDTMSSVLDRSGSEERINDGGFPIPLRIYQKREVEISTLPAEPDTPTSRTGVLSSSSETLNRPVKTTVQGGGPHDSRQYDDMAMEKSIV